MNRELILLYWSIGRDLSQRFAAEEWGGKIIDRLAQDLQTEFPGVEGFSPRNLRYMRSLAEAWPEEEILQQLVAKLPWSHNVRVLDRIKDRPTREWYLRAALEYGWSRDVLVLQCRFSFTCRKRAWGRTFIPLPVENSFSCRSSKLPRQADYLRGRFCVKSICAIVLQVKEKRQKSSTLTSEAGKGLPFWTKMRALHGPEDRNEFSRRTATWSRLAAAGLEFYR